MMPDFDNAHSRHFQDAKLLFSMDRRANADLLYGQAAECGLKWLMLKLGMGLAKDGSPKDKKDRVHANEIWTRFNVYYGYATSHIDFSCLLINNPFHNWHISHRYAHESNFAFQHVEAHQAGAKRVNDAIQEAKKSGWLP